MTVNSSVTVWVTILTGGVCNRNDPEQLEAMILSSAKEDELEDETDKVLLSGSGVRPGTGGIVVERSLSEWVDEAENSSEVALEVSTKVVLLSGREVTPDTRGVVVERSLSEWVDVAENSPGVALEVSTKVVKVEVLLVVSLVVQVSLIIEDVVEELE